LWLNAERLHGSSDWPMSVGLAEMNSPACDLRNPIQNHASSV